jgi:hypothetical protein
MRRLLFGVVVAAALAGLGTAIALWTQEGGRSAATVLTVEVPTGGSVDTLDYYGTRRKIAPLARRLAVFREPRRPTDRLPAVLLVGASRDDFFREGGGILAARSRRLLVVPGVMSLFAAPTRAGWVCVTTASEDRNCEVDLPDGYGMELSTRRGHVLVYGLLENGVEVAAAAGGRRVTVHLGWNSYLVQLPRPFPGHGRLVFRRGDQAAVVALVRPKAGR